ncbi:LysR family transcriptional regulator [Nocardia sp. BMG111209]|uniref:LysR family transcriptional regulator n=1 Tax=Nocardia sp. BMG111209 TaxID=1160137 RepID=UPI000366BC91|nr:LysR family transcriptional regulator [Nocardia sp. BMG111209]
MDLNLLTALDVLLEEGSVGAAADRLHLSQPAMSRTLGRIRRATGDQILVRSGRSMLPTPYAEQIRAEVHQLVTRAHGVLTPAADPDPATLARTFTIQCNDVIASALIPELVTRIAATAPGVELRMLAEAETDLDELRRGRVDLQVTDRVGPGADVRSATVLTDSLVAIGRRDLPADPTTPAGFCALTHVVVSRRGRRHNLIDELLEARGLRRRVALTVPTLAMALTAVEAAGLITVAPAKLGRLGPGLRSYPLPIPTPDIPAVLTWHARHERDGGHRWLRTLVGETLATIGGGS